MKDIIWLNLFCAFGLIATSEAYLTPTPGSILAAVLLNLLFFIESNNVYTKLIQHQTLMKLLDLKKISIEELSKDLPQ